MKQSRNRQPFRFLKSRTTHSIFPGAVHLKVAQWIETARERLAHEWQPRFSLSDRSLHLALGEAEALAWQTAFPHLVFPELAREKINKAIAWQRRQEEVHASSTVAFTA